MTERERAHRELQHAIEARRDVRARGDISYVGTQLRTVIVSCAYRHALDWIHRRAGLTEPQIDGALRKLAPVLLDCALDLEDEA